MVPDRHRGLIVGEDSCCGRLVAVVEGRWIGRPAVDRICLPSYRLVGGRALIVLQSQDRYDDDAGDVLPWAIIFCRGESRQ